MAIRPNIERITITIDRDLLAALKAVAALRHRTPSEYLADLVRADLPEPPEMMLEKMRAVAAGAEPEPQE